MDPKIKKLKSVWELVQAEAAKERLNSSLPLQEGKTSKVDLDEKVPSSGGAAFGSRDPLGRPENPR